MAGLGSVAVDCERILPPRGVFILASATFPFRLRRNDLTYRTLVSSTEFT
jgi:hypothetical protein